MNHIRQIFLTLLITLPVCLSAQNESLLESAISITKHRVTINGTKISYTAETGFQEVNNIDDKTSAHLFYTYYKMEGTDGDTSRPLVVSFNGGPGSASVWMHIAYTGPKVLNIDDEGYPVQPYGVKENPFSILDVADIVYVNPVNTGYSRAVKDESGNFNKKEFFGVNEDVAYLAKWINHFVTKHDKWLNPKYLIGESYGTTRVSGLAHRLQNSHWMYLNGVVLVSPTDLGIKRDGPVEVANRIPYFAAAAWYHNKLDANLQSKNIEDYLYDVEAFAINELLPALVKGGFIPLEKRLELAKKIEKFTSISSEIALQHNLEIPFNYFWKELLREDGYTVGRLDSRYKGIDEKVAGDKPDYNAELTSWLHSFTPAINHYLKHDLKFETTNAYNMFGNVYPWNRDGDTTGKQLRQAMAQNPNLEVLVQSGYFDGATTYFNAKYTMWNIDQNGKLKSRLHFKAYKSGHMMYLRKVDLENANQDIRAFILATKDKALKNSAKY